MGCLTGASATPELLCSLSSTAADAPPPLTESSPSQQVRDEGCSSGIASEKPKTGSTRSSGYISGILFMFEV